MKPLTQDQMTAFLESAKHQSSNAAHQHRAALILRAFLPAWHLPMLDDDVRNEFYERMINRKVRGKVVLDIGAGTGFLSLLIAAAGAEHVYACESNPLFFEVAKRNIQKSGYHDRITLFHVPSQELKLGKHLKTKVDVIVSEIISTDVFSENMVPTLKDASRLLKRGGEFLPSKFEVRVALIDYKSAVKGKRFAHPLTHELEDLIKGVMRPQMVNLLHLKHDRLSASRKVMTVTNGFVVKPKNSVSFKLKRTKASRQTYLCVYFRCGDSKEMFTSFGESNKPADKKLWADSWGQMLWPLPQKDSYDLSLHLIDGCHLVLTQK